ncbi:MAG: type II toxin-antitoxin system RelE/ParE family toxin [Methylobacter sp.]|nr:type II toxin-antitoxin system RelE/ParE family toxin [Methylobacter sp.]
MAWTVELSKTAARQFSKLDNSVKIRIKDFILKLSAMDNPRHNGLTMQGRHADYYRYRVGDYRLICRIGDNGMLITLVKLGYRKEVYKN